MHFRPMGQIKRIKIRRWEEIVAKKAEAQKRARELRDLMDVKPEDWAIDVRATRYEM